MKALGKRTIEQKIALETDRYMQDNYSELAYNAVSGAVPFIVKQTEAVMLCALSRHGYGAKRLKEFHDWFKAMAELPADIMGKTVRVDDCENFLAEKYGLQLEAIRMTFPDYETFKRQSDGK